MTQTDPVIPTEKPKRRLGGCSTVSSAVRSGSFAEILAVVDDLPCADFGFLVPLKRSPQYAAIRRRVADPKPVDAWELELRHYFLFELRPAAEVVDLFFPDHPFTIPLTTD